MSDTNTIDAPKLDSLPPTSATEDLMRELDKIPREYWPNLLQMIRVFGETVALKPPASDSSSDSVVTETKPIDLVEQHKALSKLLNSWVEEGDEEEQKETGDYLRRVLDEDRLSNRPLFP